MVRKIFPNFTLIGLVFLVQASHMRDWRQTDRNHDRLKPLSWGVGWIMLPAPSITEGLLVLVQLVMAAMMTAPWLSEYSEPSYVSLTVVAVCSSVNPKPCNEHHSLQHSPGTLNFLLNNLLTFTTSYLTINPFVRCIPPVSLSSKCPG